MPIWLRKFTFNLIKEYYEKQASATDNSLVSDGKVNDETLNKFKSKYKDISTNSTYSTKSK